MFVCSNANHTGFVFDTIQNKTQTRYSMSTITNWTLAHHKQMIEMDLSCGNQTTEIGFDFLLIFFLYKSNVNTNEFFFFNFYADYKDFWFPYFLSEKLLFALLYENQYTRQLIVNRLRINQRPKVLRLLNNAECNSTNNNNNNNTKHIQAHRHV